jgi:ribosomal protein S18 acetylase RimI-like enzyme
MLTTTNSLYRLTPRDALRAGEAMADAFVDDPVWRRLFEGESGLERKYQAFFEVPIRHCLKYGQVLATSENLEGIAACVPGEYADITFRRILRSGALGSAMRMGMTAGRRMADLRVLPADRAENTGGRPHAYLLLLGVRTRYRGRGLGGSLLRTLIEDCDGQGLPIYLDTETEDNVRFYEHFGFRLIKRITLENLRLPMWEMMREPHAEARKTMPAETDGDEEAPAVRTHEEEAES